MTVSDTAHKAMPGMPSDLVHVYVWQWPVRITHWFIAISIWVLSVTGIYMGYPLLLASGAASDNFLMGWAKLIHFYAAIVFSLSVISRAIWGFFGNRYANWDKFVPVRRSATRESSRRSGSICSTCDCRRASSVTILLRGSPIWWCTFSSSFRF